MSFSQQSSQLYIFMSCIISFAYYKKVTLSLDSASREQVSVRLFYPVHRLDKADNTKNSAETNLISQLNIILSVTFKW
jgi:hypothetical protein